jgi:chorismate dehydratase
VRFAHPAELAREMAAGELDVALVPIFEAFGTRPYLLADGVAIASDGPVYSVYLAHQGPLEAVETVALDPASLTSVHLLQILLAEFHGLRPKCMGSAPPEPDGARLLIGNQAIAFRRDAGPEWRFLDLGEEWRRQTGLPFVFAAWLLRPEVPEPALAAREFRALKEAGARRLEEVLAEETDAFARTYLTEHIRFDLGPREKEGIELFRALAQRYGFAPAAKGELEFV